MTINSLYNLIFKCTRKERMRKFEEIMEPTDATTVIDIGGYSYNWQYVRSKPMVRLVNINLQPEGDELPEQFTQAVGDGCNLPYADKEFDVAFSNSVIEHVGDFARQRQFAEEIRRVGRKVWVQTPSRWTFIEPHYICVFVHLLPKKWRYVLLKYFSVRGWINRSAIPDMVDEIRLLDLSEMQELFPDCNILIERFSFFPKAYIAYRNRPDSRP